MRWKSPPPLDPPAADYFGAGGVIGVVGARSGTGAGTAAGGVVAGARCPVVVVGVVVVVAV